MAEEQQRLASLDSSTLSRLPTHTPRLFEAKTRKNLTFADLATQLSRSELYVAALFYGQAQADAADVAALAAALDIPADELRASGIMNFPDRGRAGGPMPPVEPLIYRLYEVVQNYGYAFKAVLNEKFGDGIMSAICFESGVEKEVREGGEWVVITMKGKWLPFTKL